MENNRFEMLSNDELSEVEGGSLSIGAGLAIAGGVVLGLSAIVSAFNGYQEEKRKNK